MDNKQNTIRKRKKKKFKAWKVVLVVMILAILTAIGAGAGMVFAIINTAPSINIDDFANLVQSTKIYDKDGNEIESLHGEENRTYVPLSKIKKYTQDAFIAIEDERFNEHSGIDIKRIFGALLVDLKTGSPSQGASTITQQLIKNRLLSRDKLLKRKIQEAYLAIQLEKKLSKSQILEYYLNTVYLGGSAYGVQAASEYYFSKNIDQLSIAESAVIAGINQSPTYYNPYNNEKSPEVYKDRATTVLSKMLENKFITNEEFEKAKTEIDKMSSKTFHNEDNNSTLKYQWFIEAAVDSVEKDLKDKYKFTDDEITQKIYSGGLRIYTTLDPKIQEIAESVAEDPKYYPTLSKSIATWGKDKVIQPQIGVVIDDYKTGQVRAVVGGRNIKSLKSLNRATSVPRQPGSSMKPLAVYGPAFDTGYSPASVIDDSPLTPEVAKAAGWKDNPPHNFDNKFVGLTTIRDGIKVSKNIVAVKLMLKLGVRNSIEYLKKFGLQNLVLTPNKQGQTDVVNAIALGGMTKGVTPLEMAAAYGTFGNGGIYEQPILYTKVMDSQGNTILEKKNNKHEVISPQAAYLMVDTLKGVLQSGGTGSAARYKGGLTIPAAGKTGTTNEDADAYFAGFTAYYSGAIWMGHDKPSLGIRRRTNSSRTLSSGDTAWMWGEIMKQIHAKLPVKDFDKPDGIVKATVCRDSGLLPTDLCGQDPRGSRLITDMFVQGTVPTEKCNVHVKVPINIVTGKLANKFTPLEFIKEMVFIKRPYTVDSSVGDFKYQVPTETDNYTAPPQQPGEQNNGGQTPTP